ncbi:sensor histidine kinase [Alicyclobacillus kakegawensis]|uniref:sensor histidine kinase n=1 Tax=Alicyclobacillus kakegawensis TaxID=392012 RepID=UPI000A54F918|nr:sensor histidine kinase [Alicyclobacillus kakegawensis]
MEEVVRAGKSQTARRNKLSESARRRLELHYTLQERHRLARDLHDGISQDLAYASSLAKRLVADSEAGCPIPAEDVKAISRILDQSLVELRQAIYDLAVDPDEDLLRHIRRYAADFQSRYGITVEVDVHGAIPMLDAYITSQVLRVVQEALANVRKHAHAQRVQIRVRRTGTSAASDLDGNGGVDGDGIEVSISDNGRGFTPSIPASPGHYGLQTMRERCQLIGGRCQVNSEIGRGTVVTLEVPLRGPEP